MTQITGSGPLPGQTTITCGVSTAKQPDKAENPPPLQVTNRPWLPFGLTHLPSVTPLKALLVLTAACGAGATPQEMTYSEFIRSGLEAGIQNVLIGQKSLGGSAENCIVMNLVVRAAESRRPSIVMTTEGRALSGMRSDPAEAMLGWAQLQCPENPLVEQAFEGKDAQFIDGSSRRDLRDILDRKDGSLVVMPYALDQALGKFLTYEELSFTQFPWFSATGVPYVGAIPAQKLAAQAFELAQKRAPTLYTMTGELWQHLDMGRGTFDDLKNARIYFRNQGQAFCVFVDQASNTEITVIAPPLAGILDALPSHCERPTQQAIDKYRRKHPHQFPQITPQAEQPTTPTEPAKPADTRPKQSGWGTHTTKVKAGEETMATCSQSETMPLADSAAALFVLLAGSAFRASLGGRGSTATTPAQESGTLDDKQPETRQTADVEAGLPGHLPITQDQKAPPQRDSKQPEPPRQIVPQTLKDAEHTVDALINEQPRKKQEEVASTQLRSLLTEAMMQGRPEIAAALLERINYRAHDLSTLKAMFEKMGIDGEAVRHIRRSLEMSLNLESHYQVVANITVAMKLIDKVAPHFEVEPGKDTKKPLQRNRSTVPSQPDAPTPRAVRPFMPQSSTVAQADSAQALKHFRKLLKDGKMTGLYRPGENDVMIPQNYPHLHFGKWGMVYSPKPGGGHPIIFDTGGTFQPAIFDRIYTELPEDDKSGMRRVLDFIRNGADPV